MPVNNSKIIMLLLEFHPIFTGHGIYLQQLSRYLEKLGCEISVLSADYCSLTSFETVDNINVHRFKFSHQEKHWEFKLAWRVIKFLYLNRKSYDVLHIHGHLDIYGLFTLFNLLLGKHTIMQMVLLGADDPLTLMKCYKLMKIRFKILSLMDRFLCISKKLGESYRSAGLPMEKLTYIPQGVDIDRFTPVLSVDQKKSLRNRFGFSENAKILIFVGAIVERKGVDWLIDSWVSVQRNIPESLLVLVGQHEFDENDVNRDRLNGFVANIRNVILENNLDVHFAGKKLNVHEYLQCADAFVLSSRNEGFGNVILEGMATGLPVVVTYMDGVSLETVEHGKNGFIVNSVDELTDSLISLLSDEELSVTMGKVGREMAVNLFSMETIAKRYAAVYNEIMK